MSNFNVFAIMMYFVHVSRANQVLITIPECIKHASVGTDYVHILQRSYEIYSTCPPATPHTKYNSVFESCIVLISTVTHTLTFIQLNNQPRMHFNLSDQYMSSVCHNTKYLSFEN